MPELNCSLAALFNTGATVFTDVGCPEAAVVCGMNISWALADATAQDLDDMCLSEEDYLARHLGSRRSRVFLPVCVTYLTIFLVGVLGNSLTCAVILRYRVMQTPTNYYLLSLAVSDLLVLLLGMPLELYDMWENYPFLLGEGGCYFKTFLFETVCFASILNVTALSVERYVAVVHPLKVKHMTTRSHVKRVIFMLWVLSMLCAVPNTSLHGIQELPPRCGQAHLDIQPDHPDFHSGLLPVPHADHQHPLPAHWLAAAPGEADDRSGRQVWLWSGKPHQDPQAEAEQTQCASHQNAVCAGGCVRPLLGSFPRGALDVELHRHLVQAAPQGLRARPHLLRSLLLP
ncbi:neuromedin-U receptor 1-like isoform 2-T2 [Acanthopagrus schlegelii]